MCDNDQECNPVVPGSITPEPLPIPGGSGTTDFNELQNLPKYGGVKMSGSTDIPNIEGLIPSAATSANKLADQAFVNSSVSTNTAYFVGTFNTVEELEAVENPSNNDYGFVITADSAGNTVYNRYKFNSDTDTWVFEYALNNSSFTAAQWAAIQSGITSEGVNKLGALASIESIGEGLNLDGNGELSATSAGPTVVQTTGTSTTDVMSQNATTGMVYADPSTKKRIQIGNNTKAGDKANYNSVAIGDGAKAYTGNDVVIGNNAQTSKSGASAIGGGNVAIGRSAAVSKTTTLPEGGIAIGDTAVSDASFTTAIGAHTNAQGVGSIALGSYATTTSAQRGVMNIGTTVTNWGYRNSNYRLLTGLYDPQSDHDAATKGYVDAAVAGAGGGTVGSGMTIFYHDGNFSGLYNDPDLQTPATRAEIFEACQTTGAIAQYEDGGSMQDSALIINARYEGYNDSYSFRIMDNNGLLWSLRSEEEGNWDVTSDAIVTKDSMTTAIDALDARIAALEGNSGGEEGSGGEEMG